jgi:KDO2-lipid IV(A) lauroyltransferase
VTYATLRVLAAVVARLPRALLPSLGGLLGWVAGSVLRLRRELVEEAMLRAGIDDPASTAGRMYQSLGRGVVELLWTAGASEADRVDVIARVGIDPDAVRALDEARARGPVILFASHTGNWELAAAAAARHLAAAGKKLVVVAKRIHSGAVDELMARLRAGLGVRVIPPAGALRAGRSALAAGDVVVMPIDQVPDRTAHATAVSFLGAPALVDRAPATLAWRARATVLVVAAERTPEGHRVRLLEAIPPLASERRREARGWIDATTATATARLDDFVRRSPTSWLWIHRRWRAPRAAVRASAHVQKSARSPVGSRLVATRKAG